ncbi:Lipopolysaccharide-binding protein [Geodia barretti]|uniref:Lipopolysaccharide-binding protein n=1 Tax=Geodia barretti TaxID=519541 RepID=A0AA35U0F2_GEOBA|nr:Lipopolysaccharide-binding protein [Geodia barretti]
MAGSFQADFSSVVFLAALFGCCWSVNPGLRTALTSKGLNYACSVGIPILEKELLTVAIPDISGDADTPIGSISYSLSNIKLVSFKIPTASITSSSGGLSAQASGISIYVTADWHYREDSWPHISDSGSLDVSGSSISLEVGVVMGADSKGHATLSSTTCSFNIGNLDVHFSGGAAWLYNLFSDDIADSLKDSLRGQVCDEAKSTINTQGNAALETLPVIVQVDSISEIDFRLLQSPSFTSEYMETLHKGEFYSIAHPVEAPFTPPPLPPIANTTKMIYFWLTDYIAESAGFVYTMAGALQYNITPDMIPSSFPFKLNTASFKALIPELYQKFPNWPMQLDLNATKPPDFTFSPSLGGNLTVFGDMAVEVVSPTNKSMQLAFVLGLILYADASVAVKTNKSGGDIATFNATFLKVDMTLLESNVGDFNVAVLQTVVNLVCTGFVIPTINREYSEMSSRLLPLYPSSLSFPSLSPQSMEVQVYQYQLLMELLLLTPPSPLVRTML